MFSQLFYFLPQVSDLFYYIVQLTLSPFTPTTQNLLHLKFFNTFDQFQQQSVVLLLDKLSLERVSSNQVEQVSIEDVVDLQQLVTKVKLIKVRTEYFFNSVGAYFLIIQLIVRALRSYVLSIKLNLITNVVLLSRLSIVLLLSTTLGILECFLIVLVDVTQLSYEVVSLISRNSLYSRKGYQQYYVLKAVRTYFQSQFSPNYSYKERYTSSLVFAIISSELYQVKLTSLVVLYIIYVRLEVLFYTFISIL